MTSIDRIETLLDEQRSFPPPEGFRKQAHVSDPGVYEKAKKDREGYWADWARRTTSPTPSLFLRRPRPDTSQARRCT